MKVHRYGIVLAATLGLGCAQPLTVPNQGPELARILEVPQESVLFISYCAFAEVVDGGRYQSFTHGIVALTPDGIHLLGGDLNEVAKRKELRLAYGDIQGADLHHYGLGRQVHLQMKDRVIVCEITRNKETVDREGSEKAYQLLMEHGVRPWQSNQHYLSRVRVVFIPRH